MTPEYLNELADMADPTSLWKLRGLDQMKLPPDKRAQLDAGVALRRHAEHVRRLRELLGSGKSLLLTPLSPSGTDVRTVPAPAARQADLAPIDMVLHCPACGEQHVDAAAPCTSEGCEQGCACPEDCVGWTNPPHRSHLCHGCGHIWRPADVCTNGVLAVKTRGKNDSPIRG